MIAEPRARGTREEVWQGTARRTSGGLTKEDLVLSKRGKVVSKKMSDAAKTRYPALKAKLCGNDAAALQGEERAVAAVPAAPAARVAAAPAVAAVPAAAAVAAAAAAQDLTLVYFGPGWDFKPVSNKDYRHFTHFIYVDALPALQHYTPGSAGYEHTKDLPSFLRRLRAGATPRAGFTGRVTVDGNVAEFELSRGRRLTYYFNTSVEHAMMDPDLIGQIAAARWLHVQGFHPQEFGFTARQYMPNVFANLAELREYNTQHDP